jgi:hypothetical protein
MRGSAVTSDSGGIAIRRSRIESQVGVREVYERLLGSVRRVVVGKDRVVDLWPDLASGRRSRPPYGHTRGREDDDGEGYLVLDRGRLLTHPVHP